MRDLKVRAWSKVEQKMLHVSSLHFIGDSTVKEVGTVEVCCDSYLNDKSGMILMQFTGLHDKNGKEIYEGDVLRSKWGGTGIVVFDDGAFQGVAILYGGSIVACRNWPFLDCPKLERCTHTID